ncbi:hypothetical protein [Wenxinia saemankumensis]|uniref:Uncharacterized protein n=1 Tax=Wenxinia saemankumensis TaxID=1447782 RepID=A0A1M6AH62_9RHOB|nr:hypothetical protein [Wenxinia saemankumensis]SHI35866.1 hypothetical protein SAMN05444417_0434 [Wenxinia saemankumensis]
MPLEKLMLILVAAMVAAGLTIWAAATLVAAFAWPMEAALLSGIPLALVLYVLWRLVAERRSDPEDDRYDGMRH